MKPKIVLSGVNVREVGSLSIFRDALASIVRDHGDRYEVVALVKSRDLFDVAGVTYLEFPRVTRSYLSRVQFEYWTARGISAQLSPKIWVSMHDTTPNVVADVRAVYCQNASPFYKATFSEFLLDWRFGMFTLFYRFLYRINIHANNYVIVQQEWMRREFRRMYGVQNVVVAHPEPGSAVVAKGARHRETTAPYRFLYPMFPRTYKNPEVCLEAARILENRGFRKFELWLTFDASVNKYAAHVVREFSDVRSVRWLGKLPRERVMDLYEEADCLLFPSRLESWGLPISEFRGSGKPILAADLPYAHETTAGYGNVCFFDPNNAEQLANYMEQAALGKPAFEPVAEATIEGPYACNWSELWRILIDEIGPVCTFQKLGVPPSLLFRLTLWRLSSRSRRDGQPTKERRDKRNRKQRY